ncbi:ArsA family ATPase [Aquibacillus sp. 3ASR75-11]|uniref:ArsA family ATPase n=1 Tax=Terrihalobacillus insolitus TaxID=2950438 RepID=A0A9X3WTU6_9BACI|nr:ArsA family ATPase [Terrihalobacillus insolitus]MDC3412727.1 ArsA family ATPase [Terrihalobacillus insolitus]MDC3423796.1 ArsA family ATPase [Terrihalobacillus insolitus]
MNELNKSIVFVGGKGGVGKTTTAAALALNSAQNQKKTLLISTDPAHNLGDMFDQGIGGSITNITTNLDALEIDGELETEHYIKGVKENLKGLVKAEMVDEVNRQIDTAKASPGAEEAALFDKLVSIILEESDNYDMLIFDTAPTGHTIRLLSLPELMGVWMEGLLEKRKKTNQNYAQLLHDGEPVEDPIFDVLQQRQTKFKRVREILLDTKKTGFIFVLNPEKVPILETKKAIQLLDNYHLHVRTIIVNKQLPDQVEGQFFSNRKEHEKHYLAMIEQTFVDQSIIKVPFFDRDITTMDQLEEFGSFLQKG